MIWANPSHTLSDRIETKTIIQQRSAVSTGFPARYTVSLYQPPPAEAMFEEGMYRYAYGIIVTFYDRDQNEFFDIGTEPIIGFNRSAGVLYVDGPSKNISSSSTLSPGYHLFTGSTPCATHFEDVDLELPSSEGTTMIISGTTPALFDQIPDVGCDGHQREWLDLCQAPVYRASCRSASPPPSYEALCDFCSGQWPAVSLPLRRDSVSDPPTDVPGESRPPEDCRYEEPVDIALCQTDNEYAQCIRLAQNQLDVSACETARDIAECEVFALTEAERAECASLIDSDAESESFEDESETDTPEDGAD